jgi:hypothetical protein
MQRDAALIPKPTKSDQQQEHAPMDAVRPVRGATHKAGPSLATSLINDQEQLEMGVVDSPVA